MWDPKIMTFFTMGEFDLEVSELKEGKEQQPRQGGGKKRKDVG